MLEELRVCMWRFHGGVWGGRAYFIKVQGKKLRWRVDDRLSKGRLQGFSCRFCSAIKGRESWGGIALRDEAAGGVGGDRDGGTDDDWPEVEEKRLHKQERVSGSERSRQEAWE